MGLALLLSLEPLLPLVVANGAAVHRFGYKQQRDDHPAAPAG